MITFLLIALIIIVVLMILLYIMGIVWFLSELVNFFRQRQEEKRAKAMKWLAETEERETQLMVEAAKNLKRNEA